MKPDPESPPQPVLQTIPLVKSPVSYNSPAMPNSPVTVGMKRTWENGQDHEKEPAPKKAFGFEMKLNPALVSTFFLFDAKSLSSSLYASLEVFNEGCRQYRSACLYALLVVHGGSRRHM